MSASAEFVWMSCAVSLYVLAAVLMVVGFVFKSGRVSAIGLWVVLVGLGAHAVGIGGRWVRVGHWPYLGFYEVVSSYAFVSVALFLLLAWRRPGSRFLGIVLIPTAFLALGMAMLAPNSDLPITPTLASWWLNIHVSFAKLSYGSFIVSFGLAVAYLMRTSEKRQLSERMESSSLTPEMLDDLTFKFIAAGFIFLACMIVSGAIWANESWGRYWSWDPIETWSLIWWLAYGVVIHLRLTMGWRGKRFAKAAIAIIPLMLFAAVGVVIVFQSVHGAYLIRK